MYRVMPVEERRYRSFLLRLWLVTQKGEKTSWRASLEDSRAGERRGFASLEKLLEFLQEMTRTIEEMEEHKTD